MKVLSFGEIIWDVYPDKKCIGGAPLNFAAHLAGSGVHSYLLSAVGNDDLGQDALAYLPKFRVSTEYVEHNDAPTGQCIVTLDENAIPRYNVLQNVSYDKIEFLPKLKQQKFDAVSFGTLIQRSPTNADTIDKIIAECNYTEVFCDLNIRPPFFDADSILRCLRNATLVKISREELGTVTQIVFGKTVTDPAQAAQMICTQFVQIKIVIITLDADGAFAYEARNKSEHFCPAEKVTVVSTVGAGDSFGAAFLAKYLSGNSVDECLSAGVHRSAKVIASKDAIPEECFE